MNHTVVTLVAIDLPSHVIVKLPALSPTMETGTIVSWEKKVGDEVEQGDVSWELLRSDKIEQKTVFLLDFRYIRPVVALGGIRDIMLQLLAVRILPLCGFYHRKSLWCGVW